MAKKKFPILAAILLIFGLIWLLSSIGYLTIDLPWIPIAVIIAAIGMIINRYAK